MSDYYNRHKFAYMTDVDYNLFVARDKCIKFVDTISPTLLYLFTKTFMPYTVTTNGKYTLAIIEATKLVKKITYDYDAFQKLLNDTIELTLSNVDDCSDKMKKLHTFAFEQRMHVLEIKLIRIFNDIASFESVIDFTEEDFVDEEE